MVIGEPAASCAIVETGAVTWTDAEFLEFELSEIDVSSAMRSPAIK